MSKIHNISFIAALGMHLLCALPTVAQFPDTAFIRNFGGNQNDYCREVEPTYDKGYILSGNTSSLCSENAEVYVIKLDSNSNKQWSKVIGGNNIEWGYSVKQTFDTGYVIAGFTNSFGAGGYDVYLIKLNKFGDTIWTKTFGGSDWDFGYSVMQAKDSGFVICGKTYSFGNGSADVYIIKTDKNGNQQWFQTSGGVNAESGWSVISLNDTNFAIIGETKSFGYGNGDAYFVKVGWNGNIITTKTYGTVFFDAAYGIDTTSDNGFIIVGETDSAIAGGGGKEVLLLKTDADGNMMWRQIVGLPLDDIGKDVKQLPSNQYLTAGISNSNGLGGFAAHIMRFDAGGFWQAGPHFGGTDDDEGHSIALAKNGEVMFAGNTFSYGQGIEDVYTIRMRSTTIIMDYTLNINNINEEPCPLSSSPPPQQSDGFVLLFPNPFTQSITVEINSSFLTDNPKIIITDVYGKIVKEIFLHAASTLFFAENIKPGIYFYKLYSENQKSFYSGKLVFAE